MSRSQKRFPRRSAAALVAVGSAAAVVGAAALPAFAASPVPVPVTTNTSVGSRILSLSDGAGGTLDSTHGLALTPGRASSVVAGVTDTGYTTSGFQVTSTMSNLYQSNTDGSYAYASPNLPSSAVSVSRSAVPLSLSNVSANVTPVFTLTGNLTAALAPYLGTIVPTGGVATLGSVNTQVTGSLQNLIAAAGTTVDSTLASLPLSVAGGTQGAYTNPASLGGSDPVQASSTAPTTIPLLSATSAAGAPAALLAQLKSLLGNPTVSGLTSGTAPVVSTDDVVSALSAQLGVPASIISGHLAAVVGALTPALTSLTGGVVSISGLYNGSNRVTVTPPAGTVAGAYKGLLTVTLIDTP